MMLRLLKIAGVAVGTLVGLEVGLPLIEQLIVAVQNAVR